MFMTRDLATGLCRPAVTFRGQCPTLGRLRRLCDRLLLLPDSGLGRAGVNEQERAYMSMMPRFTPIMAAWVRSLAPNLDKMFLTRLLTVSSVIES